MADLRRCSLARLRTSQTRLRRVIGTECPVIGKVTASGQRLFLAGLRRATRGDYGSKVYTTIVPPAVAATSF
jgi:hypothetical protein